MLKQYMPLIIIICSIFIFSITNSAAADTGTPNAGSGKKIVVYYFHGKYRCHSCIQVEKFTRKAVSIMRKEKPDYLIEINIINKDLPENTAFVKEYRLENQSVIIAEFSGEKQTRWKDCDKIWDFYTDEKGYVEYICNEIKENLD